jgi:hypothetical protein
MTKLRLQNTKTGQRHIKRPLSLSLLGWLELISGLVGTALLLFIFFASFAALFFAKGEARMGFMALFSTPSLLPFPVLAIAGIGLLKLRPWAPALHTGFYAMVIVAGLIIAANLSLHQQASLHETTDAAAFISIAISLFISTIILIFINRPAIKKRCHPQTSSTS